MEDTIFKELKSEIYKGFQKKGHPYRYFTLATIDKNNEPQQRTVVLRKVDKSLNLTLYTDQRSQKVNEIQNNSSVNALFYNPKNQLQLIFKGKASIEKDKVKLKRLWDIIPAHSKKDYTTLKAPGSSIVNNYTTKYTTSLNHFCILYIEIETVEYLKLDKSGHQRILFTKENNEWEKQNLMP